MSQIKAKYIDKKSGSGLVDTSGELDLDNAVVALLAGAQEFTGAKTFSGGLVNSTNDFAMGSKKITGLADGSATTDAATYGQLQAVSSGIHIKQMLLHADQLSATEGVLAATVLQLDAVLDGGEILNLKKGAVATEVYTEGGNFAKGASIDETMTNLAAAISGGVSFDAVVSSTLESIDGSNTVLVIYENDDSAGDLRIWQDAGNTTDFNYIDFSANSPADYKGLAADLEALPTADPTDENFGIGVALASLETGEAHLCRSDDTGYLWDDDDEQWNVYAVPGSYTGGDGIDVTGTVISVDLEAAGVGEGGLAIDGGELRVLTDGDHGIKLTATGVEVEIEASKGLTVGASGLATVIEADKGLTVGASGLATVIEASKGLTVGASGLATVIEASKGLTVGASGLATVPNTAAGIDVGASGLEATLAAAGAGTGGLEFDGSGDFQIKTDGEHGIVLAADGVGIELDGATLTVGAGGVKITDDSIQRTQMVPVTLDGDDITNKYAEIGTIAEVPTVVAADNPDTEARLFPVGGCAQEAGVDFVVGRGDTKVWLLWDTAETPADYAGALPSTGLDGVVAAGDILNVAVNVYQI